MEFRRLLSLCAIVGLIALPGCTSYGTRGYSPVPELPDAPDGNVKKSLCVQIKLMSNGVMESPLKYESISLLTNSLSKELASTDRFSQVTVALDSYPEPWSSRPEADLYMFFTLDIVSLNGFGQTCFSCLTILSLGFIPSKSSDLYKWRAEITDHYGNHLASFASETIVTVWYGNCLLPLQLILESGKESRFETLKRISRYTAVKAVTVNAL